MGVQAGGEDPQQGGGPGKVGLADMETKDSKVLAAKYCGSHKGRRNS